MLRFGKAWREMEGHTDPLLDVQGLVTQFPTRRGLVRAVNHVSFSLNHGQTMGLVGESGCGKSMTSLSIMRLVPRPGRVVSGKILFEGNDLLSLGDTEMARYRGGQIGMIFQDPMTSLNPSMRVGDQISEGMTLHLGLSGSAARQRAIELLEMVGIPSAASRAKDYQHEFSGGMRQRAMIAIALACNPKLLIADEPTTSLDVTIQAQILELISSLSAKSGTAVILVSHDLGVIAEICEKVAVMYAGHIVESSTLAGFFDNMRHPYSVGLLRSIPSSKRWQRERLTPIDGRPPDLANPVPGCPFVPRCSNVVGSCVESMPALADMGGEHLVACWNPG
jgi:oligopeptide/dipeptide ABC transporter ATP-binding protein